MKRLVTLGTVCLLAGCLLNQTDPKPPKTTILNGFISVDDRMISNQGGLATFDAAFWIKPDENTTQPVATTLATSAGKREFLSQTYAANAASARAADCQKRTLVKLTKEEAEKQKKKPVAEPVYQGFGPIGFGPALQKDVVIIEPTEKNYYFTYLDELLPAGAYKIMVGGNPEIDPFTEILSMPEDVHHLRLDGKDFGDPTWKLDPGEDLELYWREPAIVNEDNVVALDVIMQDSQHVYAVQCGKMEVNVPDEKGHKVWTIDREWFSEMPTTGKVEFYFMRGHQGTYKTTTGQMTIQGTRTYYARPELP